MNASLFLELLPCIESLSADTLAIMLSDGMGYGEAANKESARTLRLLWKFLTAGVDISLALETVNELMLAHPGEDMFATVDLCRLNLAAGTASFSKLAACRSVILRNGQLINIEGGRLPLGILERVRPCEETIEVFPDDTIVMFSDGFEDALREPDILEDVLKECNGLPPQQMAEALLRSAESHRCGQTDDITVICVQLEGKLKHLKSGRKNAIMDILKSA